MIRCVRAMSSMGYPEVFHRFCGYLRAAREDLKIFSCDRSLALSSGRRMNFRSLAKKVLAQRCVLRTLCRIVHLARLRTLLLRAQCSREISRQKCRRARASARIVARWACSTMVSAGDSSTKRCLRGESREVDGMNSGNPSGRATDGNPEPSRRCIAGRCRDYLRAADRFRERP
jgi:hypothetical protein